MHKGFLATIVIALALVFGQISTFVIAALCPHLSSTVVTCDTNAMPTEQANHSMDHMEMESTGPLSNQVVGSGSAVIADAGSCNHCALHSSPSPGTTSFRESNIPQRSGDLTTSLPVAEVRFAPSFPASVLPSRVHGPPGSEISRHVLINIFRI